MIIKQSRTGSIREIYSYFVLGFYYKSYDCARTAGLEVVLSSGLCRPNLTSPLFTLDHLRKLPPRVYSGTKIIRVYTQIDLRLLAPTRNPKYTSSPRSNSIAED